MENILREYEVRLLDGEGRLILIVPLIASAESDIRVMAAQLADREKAATFTLRPQMSSRGYRAAPSDADTGMPQGAGLDCDPSRRDAE